MERTVVDADPTQKSGTGQPLSTARVCEMTGLSDGYIRRLARSGAIPGTESKSGGRTNWSFERSDIEQWIAKRQPTKSNEPVPQNDAAWVNDLLLSENAELRRAEIERSLQIAERDNAKLRAHIKILQRTVNELMSASVDEPEARHLS